MYKIAEKFKCSIMELYGTLGKEERNKKMDNRIPLRGELEKAIDETGCTLSQLEEKGGTQIGNLSACLRGKSLRPITYTLEFWSMVEEFAEELRILSNIVYLEELRKLNNNRSEPLVETERHLVVYYGKSYLIKGAALFKQGR
ncbi:hypothetical protein M5W68_13345 [Paenibacillus larvae]|uniref:hypothetical protein n=1 Tax=Paenibacillus larvae TaxID=1464 RepID=UPI0022817C38|nr:hypothetical protein [Paenibacillus larvae]MCY9512163.1 hypothetical protein [Paenibacillus larvae]MCY9526067.1 hypothetical protein [Paenibacillus larvae]